MITYHQTRTAIFAEDEQGRTVYSDCRRREEDVSEFYREKPFEVDFAMYEGQEPVYGTQSEFEFAGSKESGSEIVLTYLLQGGKLRVQVLRAFSHGVMAQRVRIENRSAGKLCLKQLYNCFAGIAGSCLQGEADYLRRVELGVVRGEWCGEGQLYWYRPDEFGLFRASGHNTRCTADINSVSPYTTRQYSPLLFLRDRDEGTVWAVQHLPAGPYCMAIGLTDAEAIPGSMFKVSCGAGTSDKHGFRLYLQPGENYECAESLFTCAGNFDAAVKNLTDYRRARMKNCGYTPLMFNDYMNCLWTDLGETECLFLLDAAVSAGAEGYCFDDGWYRPKGAHGHTALGDWNPCDARFGGHTFRGMVDEIRSRGMVAGLWTELEVCSGLSEAAKFPDSYFLQNEGERIFRCGRYYFNFENPDVCAYLTGKVQNIYDLGIRYIKNDYNGHPGCGIDADGCSPYAAVERHCRAVHSFYRTLRAKFPDLIIENCASGAMRADAYTMQNFNVQSISDCEEYYKIPSIINGTQLSLLPEQVSVWVYPYPRIFWQMQGESYLTQEYRGAQADGEQTIFNMVNGMMGGMLLSGKIDRADEANMDLIRRGVALHKEWRDFIKSSVPIYPLGCAHLTDTEGFIAHGLRCKNTILLALWRRGGAEEELFVPLDGACSAEEIYPCRNFDARLCENGLRARFTSHNQAVLLKVCVR